MKFGETLYKRSVPQWAAYNVSYNEIKHLIKRRTTKGIAEPLPIPGVSSSRWRELEDELFVVLKDQHDNVSLFLRSKYGELERRLVHLEKQLKGAQRSVEHQESRRTLQAKRYRKLLEEAETIGEDIQALTRFAAVQKTAFRKILKKYRKWTHSVELQTRLEKEVFSAGELNLDFTRPLERLSHQMRVITEELQGPMLRADFATPNNLRRSSSSAMQTSPITQITEASHKSALSFDAVLAVTTFGRSAGVATYWIHPDNLDEAVVLLMRHMQELGRSPAASRHSSVGSIEDDGVPDPRTSTSADNYIIYLDNAQRFLQDQAVHRSSKIAISGRWCQSSEALVTMSDLATWAAKSDTIRIKRKDLPKALDRLDSSVQRRKSSSAYAWDVLRIQEYLAEHRDVKPLGELHSQRQRFCGSSNSSQVGMWATLDKDVVISSCDMDRVGSVHGNAETGEAFPHAVLEIRWEFGHNPEVVRAFDSSYLAERIPGFSLEAAVVYASDKSLGVPSWAPTLEKDIRKVPLTARAAKRSNNVTSHANGVPSTTSSIDEPSDSVFSSAAAQSSATSVGSPDATARDGLAFTPRPVKDGNKAKKVQIDLSISDPPPQRYWNEFDDGDSDTNLQETYAIYIDPDEKFPGLESLSKAYEAVSDSWAQAKSWILGGSPFRSRREVEPSPNERTRLLITSELDGDSSDSDTTPTSPHKQHTFSAVSTYPSPRRSSLYRPHQILTKRQAALESTYLQFYSGLLMLAYILLFMSGVLLATGRKKARLEVDAGVVCGIAAAEVCAVVSIILACMRRMPLSIVHWGVVTVANTGIVVIGFGLLVSVVGASHLT